MKNLSFSGDYHSSFSSHYCTLAVCTEWDPHVWDVWDPHRAHGERTVVITERAVYCIILYWTT